jgi:hypothetical protein
VRVSNSVITNSTLGGLMKEAGRPTRWETT